MTILVSLKDAAKAYGAQTLFQNLSFGVFSGDRIGLIGPNGTGKSTLLKILAGLDSPDQGEITLKKGLKTAYLAQKDDFDLQASLLQTLQMALQGSNLETHEIEFRVHKQLSQLGFLNPHEQVKNLSGGWRKRLAIARVLLQNPDLLLLDEPTNHLDLEGILWLEALFEKAPYTIVVISHDRRFLNTSCNRILELSPEYPDGFFKADGAYNTFQEQRELFLAGQLRSAETLANRVRREEEWLARGPKARTTKAKARIEETYALQDELTALQKLNRAQKTVAFDFEAGEKKSKELLKIHNVSKSYDKKNILKKASLKLCAGARIGLMGPNGSGKSTVMKILAGTLLPDEGNVKPALGVKVLSFEQDRSSLNPEEPLKTALTLTGSDNVVFQGKAVHIITWARRFAFTPTQLEGKVGALSGGEQARVLIARLMLTPCDVLLLDEPTNDLDIASLEVLENALQDFEGAVVLVSHDRSLVENVCTQILAIDSEGALTAYADLNQWLTAAKSQIMPQKSEKEIVPYPLENKKTKPAATKLSYKDQFELDGIHAKIEAAEADMQSQKMLLDDANIITDHARMNEVCRKIGECQTKIDALYARWHELEEKKTTLEKT